jgi:hypothetical protein
MDRRSTQNRGSRARQPKPAQHVASFTSLADSGRETTTEEVGLRPPVRTGGSHMETRERRLDVIEPTCPNCRSAEFSGKVIDPSLFSTPEIWTCRRCEVESRWLKRKRPRGGWVYVGIAPSAADYPPSRNIHSGRVHANRKRARALLPPLVSRMITAQEALPYPSWWRAGIV